MKQKVLFICTHNSARSQMAEALLRTLYGNYYEAFSAGVEPSSVNPYAVEVMKELGIDLSTHRSKSIEKFQGMIFDIVVTVCDNAKEACPFFPGKKVIHKGFDDPATLNGPIEDTLDVFRRVRDEIKDWIKKTFGQVK
jgi:arsenate reductase (thioredoxin)